MPSTEQFAPFLGIFLIIAAVGLAASLYTEQTQIIAKIRGALKNQIASGYNSAMKIMLVNRFGTILFTFFLALSIDVGISNLKIIIVAMCAVSVVLCYNVYLAVNSQKILFYTPPEDQPLTPLYKALGQVRQRYVIGCYLATLLNIMGLTLPLLLSNSFPEYRLSMANTGFLLNAFFTMINVLLLEARLAQVLDKQDKQGAYEFALSIFVTRAIAILTAIMIYIALLWWLYAPGI